MILFIFICLTVNKIIVFNKQISYLFENDISECPTPNCILQPSDIIQTPTVINNEYSKKIAKYSIDLITRIEYSIVTNKSLHQPSGMEIISLIHNKNTYYSMNNPFVGFIGITNTNNIKTVWIVFRGVFTNSEWIDAINFNQTTYNDNKNVFISKGFMDIFNNIEENIINIVKNIDNVDNIIITGHSLGGVLSVLCALQLDRILNLHISMNVYSFGSPRIGNNEFVRIVNDSRFKTYRINNIADIFTQMPFSIHPNNNGGEPYIYSDHGILKIFNNNNKSIRKNHLLYTYMGNI